MSSKNEILAILEKNRGSAVSGEAISKQLDISRNAVWKNINTLKKEGYKISSVTNKGYALEIENDIISEQGIYANMKKPEIAKILTYKTVDSTNLEARRIADGKAENMTVIVSEEQTSGRGRLGRSFFSPANSGIYMSVILRPEKIGANPVLITTAVCVAVLRAIKQSTQLNPQIKWVNDLFLNNKKICGILTEGITSIESGSIEYIISGIGINFSTLSDDFPKDLQNTAGSLFGNSDNVSISRNQLIASIIENINSITSPLKAESFIDEYKQNSMIIGKDIVFIKKGQQFNAKAIDIDSTGGLIVEMENGQIQTLNSGEISVRKI
ncbi:MAG: biotin--[acetyl-CoA-carboxylase] ligase [Clostridiales bacterium]|nr:biotin--[acetyl-CoA-carboxylase] ligase [Clostridiales bacterium]